MLTELTSNFVSETNLPEFAAGINTSGMVNILLFVSILPTLQQILWMSSSLLQGGCNPMATQAHQACCHFNFFIILISKSLENSLELVLLSLDISLYCLAFSSSCGSDSPF